MLIQCLHQKSLKEIIRLKLFFFVQEVTFLVKLPSKVMGAAFSSWVTNDAMKSKWISTKSNGMRGRP